MIVQYHGLIVVTVVLMGKRRLHELGNLEIQVEVERIGVQIHGLKLKDR